MFRVIFKPESAYTTGRHSKASWASSKKRDVNISFLGWKNLHYGTSMFVFMLAEKQFSMKIEDIIVQSLRACWVFIFLDTKIYFFIKVLNYWTSDNWSTIFIIATKLNCQLSYVYNSGFCLNKIWIFKKKKWKYSGFHNYFGFFTILCFFWGIHNLQTMECFAPTVDVGGSANKPPTLDQYKVAPV